MFSRVAVSGCADAIFGRHRHRHRRHISISCWWLIGPCQFSSDPVAPFLTLEKARIRNEDVNNRVSHGVSSFGSGGGDERSSGKYERLPPTLLPTIANTRCSEQHRPLFDPASSMVDSNMMMIPGAWEPRPRAGGFVEPRASAPTPPAGSRGSHGSRPVTQRRELPGWLNVSIFAATLLAATWLAMFLERVSE